MRPPAAAWLATLACGCTGAAADDSGGPPDCLGEPTGEIGTGATAFEPLADGDDLTMEYGPQGGWHFTTSLRLSGVSSAAKLHPTASVLSYGVQVAGSQVPENRELTDCSPASCACEALNLRVFLDVDGQADICRMEGEQVEIVIAITDLTTGETGEARRVVTAQLDDVDLADCRP